MRYAAFSDIEERYRQRYADLASNPEVREVFRIRARTLKSLRRFFDEHDFLEVETPILQPVYGGAAARPFVTHHHQLRQDLYLRIAFELYLKRLLVGMYDRVYEIGHDFRNEGVSHKHNPEFTQLEFYVAYWATLRAGAILAHAAGADPRDPASDTGAQRAAGSRRDAGVPVGSSLSRGPG